VDKESLDRQIYEFPADSPLPGAFIDWAFGGYGPIFELGPIFCWNKIHGKSRFLVTKDDNAYLAINRILHEWDLTR